MDNQKEQDDFKERRTVDARIVRLEQVAENLANSVSKLTTDVGALAQLMRESNKTNWGVMATWAGVFLMLTVALGNGYVGQPLRDQSNAISTLQSTVNDHIKDGHPKTVLDKVNENTSKITARENVIRNVMQLKEKTHANQIDRLLLDISNIRKWQYDRDQNRINIFDQPPKK